MKLQRHPFDGRQEMSMQAVLPQHLTPSNP